MIEIRYEDNLDVTDIAGHSIAEVRAFYKADFGIADKAAAFLNGKKVTPSGETGTILDDEDTLVFKASRSHRVAYLVGALVLAMGLTGGIFAYGFTSGTTSINAATINSDFASVSANTSSLPSWTARGMQKNQTGSGTLFDIDTKTSGYTGDFTATITMANASELTKVYRSLSLTLEVRNSANNLVDINEDNVADNSDYTILTIENGSIILNIKQLAVDVYTVKIRNGYYICNAGQSSWNSGLATPLLYCELAQK